MAKLLQSALAGEHAGKKLQPRLIFVRQYYIEDEERLVNSNS